MMEGYVSSLEVAFFVPARKMTILLEESLKKKKVPWGNIMAASSWGKGLS